MKAQKAPWIAVCLLCAIVAFFIGTRYGQQVEQANKLSAEIVRQIPTYFPTPSPTKPPSPSVYTEFTDPTTCDIAMLKDQKWQQQKESSQSATLSVNNAPLLSYSCETNNPFASAIAKLSPTKAVWGNTNVTTYADTTNRLVYAVVPTEDGPTLYLRMSTAVAPLVAKTLTLTPAK